MGPSLTPAAFAKTSELGYIGLSQPKLVRVTYNSPFLFDMLETMGYYYKKTSCLKPWDGARRILDLLFAINVAD